MPVILASGFEMGALHCTIAWPAMLNSHKSYILLDLFLCTRNVASLLQHGFRYCGSTLGVVNSVGPRCTEAYWVNT